MTSGAGLRFAQRAGPNAPVNPAQASEPGIVTMNGKDYRITLEIQVNGVWKKVDPKTISNSDHLDIAEQCHKIYQKTTQKTDQPNSITVYFEQKNLQESWTSWALGTFDSSYKDEVVDLTFNKIEYKTANSDELHVWDIKTHDFTTKTDAIKVNELARSMTKVSKAIFGNPEQFLERTTKIKNQPVDPVTKSQPVDPVTKSQPVDPVTKSQPVDSVTKSMSQAVSDAGTTENRCASLSLAKRELAQRTPEEIIARYELPETLIPSLTNETNSDAKIQLLSEALIEKAANNIIINLGFRDPYITLQNQPCLAAIERALIEYQSSHVEFEIPATPDEKVAVYASLIRQSNFMLDLPFFLALEQPFIIIRKDNKNNFMIDVKGHHYTIPDTIKNCDLEDVNIVYYNGVNHYQSVILSENAQKEAMRTLLRKDIDGQIEGFIPRLRAEVQAEALLSETADMVKFLHFYPLAKSEIIDRFKIEYPNKVELIENLIHYSNDEFAAHLRKAIR